MVATQTDKKSRGNGPFAIAYLDAEGKPHKRVNGDTTRIQITDRTSNKAKVYDVDKLSDEMFRQCTVGFVGDRIKSFTRNTLLNRPDATILGCADEVFAGLLQNEIWKRGEGEGKPKGKPIDYGYWHDVMTEACKRKGEKASPEAINKFVEELKALTRKEFNARTKELAGNVSIEAAMKHVDLARANKKLKEVGTPDIDLLSL